VNTPARSGLEALWARAGMAGSLRLEVENVRVAEQERSLAEAMQHLEQWDCLVRDRSCLQGCHPQCSWACLCPAELPWSNWTASSAGPLHADRHMHYYTVHLFVQSASIDICSSHVLWRGSLRADAAQCVSVH
jgi:hypothetical protein